MNAFTQECKNLERLFFDLKYPESLIKSIIKKFMDDLQKEPTATEKPQVMRIVLPFKDQRSANTVRLQPSELSLKIGVQFPGGVTSG